MKSKKGRLKQASKIFWQIIKILYVFQLSVFMIVMGMFMLIPIIELAEEYRLAGNRVVEYLPLIFLFNVMVISIYLFSHYVIEPSIKPKKVYVGHHELVIKGP